MMGNLDLEEEEELQEEACLFSNSGISDSLDFRLLQRKCWGIVVRCTVRIRESSAS